MGLFNFSKKEPVPFGDVLASFDACIECSSEDKARAGRRKARELFRNSNVRKEDIVNALMEKYYVTELTKVPEPVDIIHGNERYQVILELSIPGKKIAQKLTTKFVKALLGITVSDSKFCEMSMLYAYHGRTQLAMTLYRCSDRKEWGFTYRSCEMVRNNEALAEKYRVFCEACSRGVEAGDPEYALFMLDKTNFWEE